MSTFATTLLPTIKLSLRESSSDFDEEIKSYIDGCVSNLETAGILSSFFKDDLTLSEVDPQIVQAIRLYCLSYYGLYNSDAERYQKAYESIKATLCTNRKYIEEESNGV